jgi:hypothetical protein
MHRAVTKRTQPPRQWLHNTKSNWQRPMHSLHRHDRAGPGQQWWRSATTGGRDKPGHDDGRDG